MEIDEKESDGSKNGREGKCHSRGMIHQLLNVGAVVLYGATLGATMGYSAILLPQIQSNGSSIQIDEDMGSWIASLQSGVSPFGTVVGGLFMDRWGRRFTMRVGLVPLLLGYLTIAFAQSYKTILIGRFITGITAGFSAAASSVILCEIATTRLRGLYASSTYTAVSVGILLVYTLGTYLQWDTVAGLLAILPLSSFILFLFVPESPVWLAKRGKN